MITEVQSKCSVAGCANDATVLVADSQYSETVVCCEKHAQEIDQLSHSEYSAECPNCHCRFGVG